MLKKNALPTGNVGSVFSLRTIFPCGLCYKHPPVCSSVKFVNIVNVYQKRFLISVNLYKIYIFYNIYILYTPYTDRVCAFR